MMNSKRRLLVCIGILATVVPGRASDSVGVHDGYRIEQPGTITFTVGVKISGKVEKPQVMIFLPKERTLYRKEKLENTYSGELQRKLPFVPLVH